jgi:nitrate reductase gamma subunit
MLDWNVLSPCTQLLIWDIHHAAVAFMVAAYVLKIRQLLSTPLAVETTPARGSHRRGVVYSYALLVRPWKMESHRTHWWAYAEFALLHSCMAVAIGFGLAMPWAHEHLAAPVVVQALQIVFGLATLLAVRRLLRRAVQPTLRAISSPDDYFSLLLLTAWTASGVLAAPQTSESWLATYFALTTALLIYVPFSKISHYVYWFLLRYYMGYYFGHRGVFPAHFVPGAASQRAMSVVPRHARGHTPSAARDALTPSAATS